MERNVADTVNYVLEQNIQGGTGTRAKFGKPAAGKTGTTQNYARRLVRRLHPRTDRGGLDGLRPHSGRQDPGDDQRPGQKVTGSGMPAMIWKKFMTNATKGAPLTTFKKPKLGGEVLKLTPDPEAVLAQAGAQDGRPGEDMVPAAATKTTDDEQAAEGRDDEETARLLQQDQQSQEPDEPDPPPPVERIEPKPVPTGETLSECFPFCP